MSRNSGLSPGALRYWRNRIVHASRGFVPISFTLKDDPSISIHYARRLTRREQREYVRRGFGSFLAILPTWTARPAKLVGDIVDDLP